MTDLNLEELIRTTGEGITHISKDVVDLDLLNVKGSYALCDNRFYPYFDEGAPEMIMLVNSSAFNAYLRSRFYDEFSSICPITVCPDCLKSDAFNMILLALKGNIC